LPLSKGVGFFVAMRVRERRTNPSDVRALVVGVGGLGCPAALALARAGVGTLGLVDPDVVEPSNLPRQLLYDDADVGRAKAGVATGATPHFADHLRSSDLRAGTGRSVPVARRPRCAACGSATVRASDVTAPTG